MKGAPAAFKKKGGFLCLLVSWAAVALVYGLDQWSKHWVLHSKILRLGGRVGFIPSLDFVLVWNRAVTFGMLGGVASRFGPVVFVALALAAVLALAVVSWRSRFCWVRLCCGFIMGGALGNVHDRMRYGAVVDFIHFYIGSWSWYIFNLADAAIVGGVLGWMGFSFLFPNSKVPADPKIPGPEIPSSGEGRNMAAGN